MAAPATIDEFFDLMRKSGVVEENRLDAYLERLGSTANLPEDLGKAAGVLVRDGVLTHFQAEQLLAGKWRRFTIGKYKVLERLGSGGMGSVYLCEHLFMRRRVAVKVLPTAKAEDPSALERFYREARAVAALDHPNIVRAYDIDQDDKLHFLVMEYIDGASLQEIVKRHGAMEIRRVANYIRQAAAGLLHAHLAAGLIHRDIKPGNILLDRRGTIKVLDMGLARFFNDDDQPITQKFDENVLGTADYLAPEQALDSHNVDIRADIYSLGATFYFCLTGSTPFEGTVAQKLIWHQTRPPRPVRSVRPDVPEEIASIVEKMMSKDPNDRYATPLEVEDALAPWTVDPIPQPPEHEMPRLSPAAMGGMGTSDGGPSSQSLPPSSTIGQPSSRRFDSKPPYASPRPLSGVGGKPSSMGRHAPSSATVRAARAENLPRESNSLSFENETQSPETVDAHGHADTAPQPIVKPVTSPMAAKTADAVAFVKKQPPWVLGLAGGALVALFTFGIWRMSRPEPSTAAVVPGPPATIKKHGSTTFFVKKRGGPGSKDSIRAALYLAQPGDVIAVQDDEVEEDLRSTLEIGHYGDGVLVEAQNDAHLVHWSCPADTNAKFLALGKLKNFHLKGFVLDAKGRVPDAVSIIGSCPGLLFEDVTFSGFTNSGVACWGADGEADNSRITFKNCRFLTEKPVQAALRFEGQGGTAMNKGIRLLDSRLEGPFEAAIRFAAPAIDIELSRNRFFRCGIGILYERSSPRHQAQWEIKNNCFAEIPKTALLFQAAPLAAENSRIRITNNLFYHCGTAGQLDEHDVGEESHWVFGCGGNARDPATKEGNLPLNLGKPLDLKLDTNPADALRFLRYPKGAAMEHMGLDGAPVGVPPLD
jgi:eukaryotic-like serine/threonine-protein kinase